MKYTKKALALFLALCVMITSIPFTAKAEENSTLIDAAVFCSDVHGDADIVSSAFKGIKNADSTFSPSTATFVGDTQIAASIVTSATQSVFPNAACYYSFGDHDKDGNYGIDDYTGLLYGDSSSKYYIYAISQTAMESSNPDTTGFTNAVAGLDKTKPLFIASHLPLHDRRDDNKGAAAWYTAISEAAEKMDIVFFWAHNHTGESDVDREAFYVAKDGKETITLGNTSTPVIPNFTYMNAGFVRMGSSRGGVVSTVKIYEDSLVFQDYNSSGTFTGTYAHNVTVAREFASSDLGDTTEVTLESISVTTMPSKTTYTIGETFSAEGMVVTGTYSDGTTGEITGYELSDVDMSSEGTKTVTVTYEDVTTTFEITVTAASEGGDTEDDGTTDDTTGIVLPNPTTVQVTGSSSDIVIYKLVDSLQANGEYLIVSSNTVGSGYALTNNSGSVSSDEVTIESDTTNGTYIELDNDSAVWKAVSNSRGYNLTNTLDNTTYYIEATGSTSKISIDTKDDNTSRYWSYSDDDLAYYGGNQTHYIYYSSGFKSAKNSGSEAVYIYQKETVASNVSGTYSIAGNPAELSAEVTNGTTATLESILTFTSDSGEVTTTDTSTTATYEIYSDPNGIISGNVISGNKVTFSGNYGTAIVKVSYEVAEGKSVDNYIVIEATAPTPKIDITDGSKPIYDTDGTTITGYESVTETIVVKGIEGTVPYQLNYLATLGDETVTPDEAQITWVSGDTSRAIVDENGLVTIYEANGTVDISVYYEYADGRSVKDTVTFSLSINEYVVPEDGTGAFPEYPNEGSIRFDKTAVAVGNFSETGIAQVELSMTGVPYTTGSEIDVVLMLDMTGSMTADSMSAAEASALAFAQQIILNEDGTYNNNRISVQIFNKNGVTVLWELSAVKESTYEELVTAIESASGKRVAGGTPYSTALGGCYTTLQAAKADDIEYDRQQFAVFVSDGTPTSMTYITNYDEVKAGNADSYTTGTNSDYFTSYPEYYSTLMKDDGVTVYGVYTSAAAGSSGSSGFGGSVNDTEKATEIMQNVASSDDKVYVVEDYTNTSAITDVFTNIAVEIKQAATNVVVQDKIADDYTMVFNIPTGTKDITGLDGQEFYIEVKGYTLDAEHERTSEYNSLSKIYLSVDSETGNYYAASDKDGTRCETPVFTAVEEGEKGYYSVVDSTYAAKEGEIVIDVAGTSYMFIYDGSGDYNMTSGAYAFGTIDSGTNMSKDLVIVTPHFCYSAETRMLAWTAEKLTTTELAISYFLYLDKSATEVGTENEVDAATYPTNDYAHLTYTNFQGVECQQTFPIPQMTWNGAQVSYVFYLVNENGQPVNRAGKVIPFAEAIYVTDVYTHAVTWNKDEGTKSLDAAYLAKDLVPSVYALYDEAAEYEIHVYETNDDTTINDYFIIEGSKGIKNPETTKVFNTKAGNKYSIYGAYSATDGTYMDTDGKDSYKVTADLAKEMVGFDFANTTVAFAVVWQPALAPDTVVIDYGLPVVIDVTTNDSLASGVVGVRTDAPKDVVINSGTYDAAKSSSVTLNSGTAKVDSLTSIRYTPTDMTFGEKELFYYESDVNYYKENEAGNQELVTTSMYSSVTVIPATTIYYEDSFVTFTDGISTESEDITDGRMGSWSIDGTTKSNATQAQDRPGESDISASLDADNLYGYDDAYAECSKYSLGSAKKVTVSAYNNPNPKYNTAKVEGGTWPTAAFTFTGSGFDIISLTSKDTGVISVDVYKGTETAGEPVYSWFVDTYYGYTFTQDTTYPYVKHTFTYGTDGQWHLTSSEEVTEAGGDLAIPDNPEEGSVYVTYEKNGVWETTSEENALYQIPVIKSDVEMTHGTYTVVITPTYSSGFDNAGDGSYDFYLDAIRVYDPANDGENDTVIKDAYVADNEGWPAYTELRNMIIAAEDFNVATTDLDGIIFIDGVPELNLATVADAVTDYTNYGPNNEIYLAAGQAVAFNLNAGTWSDDGTLDSSNIASVQVAVKAVNGEVDYKIYDASNSSNAALQTVATATDLYQDITVLNGKTVVITNAEEESDVLLSITNIKVTFNEDPTPDNTTTDAASNDLDLSQMLTVNQQAAEAAVFSLRRTVVDDSAVEDDTTSDDSITGDDDTSDDDTAEDSDTSSGETTNEVIETFVNTVKEAIKWLNSLFGR